MTTRNQIAANLLKGCPAESRSDHQALAAMLRAGRDAAEILDSPECDRWPETRVWLKGELADMATGRPITLPGRIGALAKAMRGVQKVCDALGGIAPSTLRRYATGEITPGRAAQSILDRLESEHLPHQLLDSDTAEYIRQATPAEVRESLEAGEEGHILVEIDGVTRRCYAQ